MNLRDLIANQLSDQSTLDQVGRRVGANPDQVRQLAELGLPAIAEALSRNASTPEGAQALARALDQHQNDPVGDVPAFLNNVDTADGAKILEHVFADRNERVQRNLAGQTGLSTEQVLGLLVQFAPLVIGMLGNQKKTQAPGDSGMGGLASILSGIFADSSGASDVTGMAGRLLDVDGR